jgi:hypothetical protein
MSFQLLSTQFDYVARVTSRACVSDTVSACVSDNGSPSTLIFFTCVVVLDASPMVYVCGVHA